MGKIIPIILSMSVFANLNGQQIATQVQGLSQKENIVIKDESYTVFDKKAGFVLESNVLKSINIDVIKEREKEKNKKIASKNKENVIKKTASYSEESEAGPKPLVQTKQREMFVTLTAYSSTVSQCDASPFITASGTRVHEGTVAANFLPFGTKIKIPELYGDRIFVVEDRMSNRFWYVVDVWMPTYNEAIQLGRRQAKIVIID